jgi:siroheme synthase-like protein
MLDVTDRLVVIIGGGSVASRKASGVLEAGARRVRMVAPSFEGHVPDEVERVTEKYQSRHLDGAGLVFAATDSTEVNNAVLRDARSRGVLACRADLDDEQPGDFVTPAKLVRGRISVTVSAGSAALSAAVRDGIERSFDSRWEAMADAMKVLRPRIRESGIDQSTRAALFRELAGDDALDALEAGGVAGLERWLAMRHPELSWS